MYKECDSVEMGNLAAMKSSRGSLISGVRLFLRGLIMELIMGIMVVLGRSAGGFRRNENMQDYVLRCVKLPTESCRFGR